MKIEDLEKIGGWRKRDDWWEKWYDRFSEYHFRCLHDCFDEDEDSMIVGAEK